jgi:hypothetical protein
LLSEPGNFLLSVMNGFKINSLKITFKHIFIRMSEIIKFLKEERKNIFDTNRYHQFQKDIGNAEEVLIMSIAIYFFARVWTLSSIKKCKKLIPKIMDYNEII